MDGGFLSIDRGCWEKLDNNVWLLFNADTLGGVPGALPRGGCCWDQDERARFWWKRGCWVGGDCQLPIWDGGNDGRTPNERISIYHCEKFVLLPGPGINGALGRRGLESRRKWFFK